MTAAKSRTIAGAIPKMRVVRSAAAFCAALMLCVSSASAQRNGRGRPRPEPPARANGLRNDAQRNGAQRDAAPRRRQLEQQFRQRSEQIVRQRLNLSDAQVAQLRSVNAGIGAQRNSLADQERAVRSGLRDEMAKGSAADQRRVADLMAQAHDLQARRFALQQTEQQQLAGFLTPVQVAQYVGLQAQIRQKIRQMMQGSGGVVP